MRVKDYITQYAKIIFILIFLVIYSQGLSLVASSYTGEDILLSFGGYNGRYCNDVSSYHLFAYSNTFKENS